MAFRIYNNSTQYAQFIVLIIFTPLGIAVTVLRFVATRYGARKPGLEDWMAAIATLFFALTNFAGLMAISILNGRLIVDEIVESPSDYKRMRQWDMAGFYFYFVHFLTVKLSVLALFHRIFGINRAYRIWIYIIAGIQTALFVIFCIFEGLQCQPFDRYFDRSIPGTCKDDGLVIISGETPNSLVDFAMVILAMVMIRPRQLPSSTKWRLRALFGLGAIVGILGFIKIAVTYSMSSIYAISLVSLWTCVQMFVSLLCCCLPVFQPMMTASNVWSRLTTHMAILASLGRSSRDRSTARSAPVSGKRSESGDNSVGELYRGWDSLEHLEEYYSTNNLAAPQKAYQVEAHALHDVPIQSTTQLEASQGVHVQRQFGWSQ